MLVTFFIWGGLSFLVLWSRLPCFLLDAFIQWWARGLHGEKAMEMRIVWGRYMEEGVACNGSTSELIVIEVGDDVVFLQCFMGAMRTPYGTECPNHKAIELIQPGLLGAFFHAFLCVDVAWDHEGNCGSVVEDSRLSAEIEFRICPDSFRLFVEKNRNFFVEVANGHKPLLELDAEDLGLLSDFFPY